MATKSKTTPVSEAKPSAPPKVNELEWGGYIDVRLSDEDKEHFKDWAEQLGTQLWLTWMDCLGVGLKYGLTYDPENMCFIATFTGRGAPTLDRRFCLTARAGDWEEATKLLVYKHEVLLQGDWGNFKPAGSRGVSWG